MLFFDDAGARESVEGHLARAKVPAVRVYVEWLARTGPKDLTERVAIALRPLSPADVNELSSAMSTAILRQPAAREGLLRTWLRVASGSSWRSALDTFGADAEAEPVVLAEALKSDDPSIRQETVWAIVHRLARGQPVATATLDAALPPPGGSPQPQATPIAWEDFGRELVARRYRKEQTADRSEFLTAQAPEHRRDAFTLPLLTEITTAELSALRKALGENGLATALPEGALSPSSPKTQQGQAPARTVPLPWPTLLADLLEKSGCKATTTPRFGAFEISYRPDGRPAGGSVDTSDVSRECGPALAALARMTLADPKHAITEGETQWVLVPLSRDFLTCVAEPTPRGPGRELTVGGKIVAPRKVHDVRPIYPKMAQQDRIQGIVVLAATIAPSGCVTSLSILRSAHRALNFAAVQAVSGWRFSPSLLDGQPVPVNMTVSVNFTLQ